VPVTVKVNPALPAMAELGLIELMVGSGLLIVSVSVALPVPPALVALIVTLYVPAVVGVPSINPKLLDGGGISSFKPGGNPVAPKLVGLLLAVI
jgi:hypothetical protein